MNTRRRFFRRASAILAALPWLGSCDQNNTETNAEHLSDDNFRVLLDSFVDTIVPEDQDPGALTAGIPELLLSKIAKKPAREKESIAMLHRIDITARRTYQQSFTVLDQGQRENILHRIEISRDQDDHKARDLIRRLRSQVIREFYQSATGRAMLGYTPPFPNGYPDYSQPPPV